MLIKLGKILVLFNSNSSYRLNKAAARGLSEADRGHMSAFDTVGLEDMQFSVVFHCFAF